MPSEPLSRGRDGQRRNRQNNRPVEPFDLTEFYSAKRFDGRSLLECWDAEQAGGDSVTPASYYPSYRTMITTLIVELIEPHARPNVLSVGCGNGHVEKDLVKRGYLVQAIDVLPEAVAFARSRGVPARLADVRSWRPDGPLDLIYADGVFGHLYNPDLNTVDGLADMASWLTPGGLLVVSSDSPKDGPVQSVPHIPSYWWLSTEFLQAEMLRVDLRPGEVKIYRYERPQSGYRARTITTASAM